jgi:uncharacterized protein YycO
MRTQHRYSILWLCICTASLFSGCATDRLITRHSHSYNHIECWERISESDHDANLLAVKLEREVEHYQYLLEEALAQREQGIKLVESIKDIVKKDQPIPPWMLEKLNIGMQHGLDLTDRVVAHIASNECWFQATPAVLQKRNLSSIDSYTRFKGFMIAFSGTLALYDTYYSTAHHLNDNERIRQFLNRSDTGYERQVDQLRAVTKTIFNTENIQLVKREIAFFEENLPAHRSQLDVDDTGNYLYTLIKQSPSYAIISAASDEYIQQQLAILTAADIDDSLSDIGRDTANELSKLFGNVVGLIEERKGKLYAHKQSYDHLSSVLSAGDILLEKTPFRLTDKMIPGHWGHAAIWIGTRHELEQLGIWEDPLVQKYQAQISSAHSVVEALRSGVEMNTLAHFMNIDDIAVVRDPHRTPQETAQRILRTLRQVGKEYDFNFDVETTDKIVCSQLVYIAYSNIPWPTAKVMGRYTVSPDNIADKILHSGPLTLVTFYHDGKRIDDNPVMLMEQLMQKR